MKFIINDSPVEYEKSVSPLTEGGRGTKNDPIRPFIILALRDDRK